MTAENSGRAGSRSLRSLRFNEAAADDRGKRRLTDKVPYATNHASMRPRPMTAENAGLVDGPAGRIDALQ